MGKRPVSLGTSKPAIAALLASLFPRFPNDPRDCRYHLQAFRHLYVLAAEARCVDAVARPFLSAFTNPDAAAHAKLRADASAYRNTLVTALSGAHTSTIDELRPDNRRPAVIKTDADADADPVAGALDGRADGGLPDGVPARRRRHE